MRPPGASSHCRLTILASPPPPGQFLLPGRRGVPLPADAEDDAAGTGRTAEPPPPHPAPDGFGAFPFGQPESPAKGGLWGGRWLMAQEPLSPSESRGTTSFPRLLLACPSLAADPKWAGSPPVGHRGWGAGAALPSSLLGSDHTSRGSGPGHLSKAPTSSAPATDHTSGLNGCFSSSSSSSPQSRTSKTLP